MEVCTTITVHRHNFSSIYTTYWRFSTTLLHQTVFNDKTYMQLRVFHLRCIF